MLAYIFINRSMRRAVFKLIKNPLGKDDRTHPSVKIISGPGTNKTNGTQESRRGTIEPIIDFDLHI